MRKNTFTILSTCIVLFLCIGSWLLHIERLEQAMLEYQKAAFDELIDVKFEVDPKNKWMIYRTLIDKSRTGLTEKDIALIEELFSYSQAIKIESLLGQSQSSNLIYEELVRALPDKNILYDYLQPNMSFYISRATRRKLSAGYRSLDFAWEWGYCALAATIAFERTGDERFALLVLDGFKEILKYRDSELGIVDETRNRSLAAWGEQRGSDGVWWNSVTATGMITYPVAKLLYALDERPNSVADAYPLEVRKIFVTDILKALKEFDSTFKSSGDLGWQVMSIDNKIEPLNHTHAFAASMFFIHKITNDQELHNQLTQLSAFFEHVTTITEQGTLIWPYGPNLDQKNTYQTDVENVWKSNITMLFPLEGSRNSEYFDPAWSHLFANTVKQTVLLNQQKLNTWFSVSKPRLFSSLDKSDQLEAASVCMFALLGDEDPEIVSLIEDAVAMREELFPGGWLENRVCAVGYASRLVAEKF